jgi:hypothetical protein
MAARTAGLLVLLLPAWVVPAAQAQSATFEVIAVNTTGCSSGQFSMFVERAGLDGGDAYIVRTVVTVGGLIYMNEQAAVSVNGLSGWNVFNNFTYGAVPNPGTYPIPSNQKMRVDFTLERPKGAILYAWRLIVDGCNTGNILYNGLFSHYDVDADGETSPLTDGLLILRYMFGFRGATLVTLAVGVNCTRCDAPSIEAFLASHHL